MSDRITGEKRDLETNEHLADFLEKIPCAAYIAQNDADLTLIAGNSYFYRLFGCTEEDMRCKYGNRIGALLDADSLKVLDEVTKDLAPDGKTAVDIRQRIKRNGADVWLRTKITKRETGGAAELFCTSFDVSGYETERKAFEEYEEAVRFVAWQANLDTFEYNIKTQAARIYHSHVVLPDLSEKGRTDCPDFVEKLIVNGLVCPGYEQAFRRAFRALLKDEGKTVCDLQMRSRKGTVIWARLTLALKQPGQKTGYCVVGIFEDVTEQKEAVRRYLNETQFYQAMLSEKDAYAQLDVTEDRITRIGGMWNLYNEIIDKVTYSELIEQFVNKVVHPEDRKHYLETMQCSNYIQSLENGIDTLGCEFRRIVEQNKMMWMQFTVHLFRDPLTHHVLALLYIKNIDAKKKQEMLLLRDSTLDQLTNVFNRKVAENAIREYLKAAEPEELCAFIILDVDNFKFVNDSYGHKAGDQVLIHLTDILGNTFRKNDIIGRFGGDEFIIFLKNIQSSEWLNERLKSLYELIRIRQENDAVQITCSAGVSQTRGNESYEQMFRRADAALYMAKNAGKNCFRFCDSNEDGELVERARPTEPELPRQRAHDLPVLEEIIEAEEDDSISFDSFISEQGDIAYLVDPDTFDLISGNKAFYDRIGMSEAQCAGMKCYEAMQKRDTPCPFCSKANWSTDKFYLWKNLNIALEQEFLIKNKLVQWRGQEVLLALAVDISNNKSIVDSLDNGVMESHSILSGVQRMAEEDTLAGAMNSALETIGYFFRADRVRLWQRKQPGEAFECAYLWSREGCGVAPDDGQPEINAWLDGKKLDQPVMLENPEAMLCYSYDMYTYMKSHHIRNQRWTQVKDCDTEMGCISIDNSSSNFQNVSFLESFSVFIANELKKRGLMEGIIYSDSHDDLTGLLSRRSYEEYVTVYNPDDVSCIGVMMANLNNLKGINSTCGFQTGNYYIKQFAGMLRSAFPDEQIYRLNGDEFLVIAADLPRALLEEKIGQAEASVHKNGSFTVSFGHSWDDIENDLGALIEQATQTMKLNKKRHYDSNPTSVDMERRKMLSDLVASLENHEFEVFLQPKVELLHNKVIGAEALVRYRHEEMGYIQPSQFIGMLEKNNLIRYIDLFVFEEVCKQLEKWKKRDSFSPIVSLNFSRLTLLERDILSSMEAIISRYDISKKHIEIEITESVSNMGKSVLLQAARDLYRAGFAISLDDFGTKYTNLSILADIDFSMLKLDKSLVGELETRRNHQLILKNIIYMCKDLGIDVLAEGIETKEQEKILRRLECQMGQGYLYGKPMPITEFDETYVMADRFR